MPDSRGRGRVRRGGPRTWVVATQSPRLAAARTYGRCREDGARERQDGDARDQAGEPEASQLTRTRGGWRIKPAAVEEWMQARSNRQRLPRPPGVFRESSRPSFAR